jgi:hypothetical protein
LKITDKLKKICANCGCTYGAHNATSYYSDYYKMFIPYNYCPGHEGRMDWDNGPGTTFEPVGGNMHELSDDMKEFFVQLYMKKFNIDYKEAERMVEIELDKLNTPEDNSPLAIYARWRDKEEVDLQSFLDKIQKEEEDDNNYWILNLFLFIAMTSVAYTDLHSWVGMTLSSLNLKMTR